jgi:hypothetical protein
MLGIPTLDKHVDYLGILGMQWQRQPAIVGHWRLAESPSHYSIVSPGSQQAAPRVTVLGITSFLLGVVKVEFHQPRGATKLL